MQPDPIDEQIPDDPLLRLRGSGAHIWANEHADEYVARLRDGWDSTSEEAPNEVDKP